MANHQILPHTPQQPTFVRKSKGPVLYQNTGNKRNNIVARPRKYSADYRQVFLDLSPSGFVSFTRPFRLPTISQHGSQFSPDILILQDNKLY